MIQIPVINAITKLGGGLLGIVDQFVEDKDLKAKLAIRQIELVNELILKLLETKTIPWIDGTVKLMVASVQLARPIGTGLMTAFGIYLHVKGTPIDDQLIQYGMDAAFPTWAGAREIDKSRKNKLANRQLDKEPDSKWDGPEYQ